MTAAAATRNPHPVQASLGLAAAWVARHALGVGIDLLVVLSVPALGSIFAGNTDDPDRLTYPSLLVLAAVVAMTIARRAIANSIQMRVPGGLLAADSADAGPTRLPDDIAAAVRSVVICVAAVTAAQIAVPDKNFTAVVLSGFGGAILALAAATATTNVLADPRNWVPAVARVVLTHALPGAFALAAGTMIAPSDNAPTVYVVAVAAMGVLVIEVAKGAARCARVRETVHGVTDMAAETLVSQHHPAPTVADRAKARLWARGGLYAIAAASLVVLFFF